LKEIEEKEGEKAVSEAKGLTGNMFGDETEKELLSGKKIPKSGKELTKTGAYGGGTTTIMVVPRLMGQKGRKKQKKGIFPGPHERKSQGSSGFHGVPIRQRQPHLCQKDAIQRTDKRGKGPAGLARKCFLKKSIEGTPEENAREGILSMAEKELVESAGFNPYAKRGGFGEREARVSGEKRSGESRREELPGVRGGLPS